MYMNRTPLAAAMSVALLLPGVALAALPAIAPDAGRLSRELQQPVEAPRPGTTITLPDPSRDVVTAGGLKVMLKGVTFTGVSVFSASELSPVVQAAIGKSHDLAGLYALANAVSAYYRDRGYAFAKAFVPANGFSDGTLTITVVEGRYGQLTATADSAKRSKQAQKFVAPLMVGAPIYAPDLERQVLLLDDQPGYDVLPIIKPGREVGTGDLDVKLTRQPLVTGSLGANNHGNRYTGYYQGRAAIQLNSPLMVGDQLAITTQASDERLQSTSLGYSLPVGGNGLRATAGYSYTSYRLAREFANLQASGRAQTTSAGLSYPVLRSRTANLSVSAQVQHKRYYDEQRAVNAQQSRASDNAVIAVNFDRADGRGVSYGQVEWAFGRFDGPTPNIAGTNGRFTRVNADVVRLQRLSNSLSLYLRANGQKAGDNLDSSESYSLGGPYAVRAYPTGEGTGDEGVLGQLELRYRHGTAISPYVFFDAGHTRLEHKKTAPGKNSRSLSGAGIGVRYQAGPWSLDTVMARRLVGGDPETDPRDGHLMAWLMLNYAF